MNKIELCDRIRRSAEQMGIALPEQAPEQFYLYHQMIDEANSRMNLTRVLEPEEAVDRHFMDSLAPLSLGWTSSARSLCDVGTGAGFPGIPLAIACPELRVVLLDSLNKRVEFLKQVIAELGLNAQAIHGRAEELARKPELRDAFDLSTARAVAALPTLLELTLPFVRPGGAMICYKGPGLDEEMAGAQNALNRLCARVDEVQKVSIPGRDWDHRLVKIKKLAETPRAYPRKPGDPNRKPL
jgi:16S rRNA (guanine527-N7)-methyltransferase